jgi:hypothetical protein
MKLIVFNLSTTPAEPGVVVVDADDGVAVEPFDVFDVAPEVAGTGGEELTDWFFFEQPTVEKRLTSKRTIDANNKVIFALFIIASLLHLHVPDHFAHFPPSDHQLFFPIEQMVVTPSIR